MATAVRLVHWAVPGSVRRERGRGWPAGDNPGAATCGSDGDDERAISGSGACLRRLRVTVRVVVGQLPLVRVLVAVDDTVVRVLVLMFGVFVVVLEVGVLVHSGAVRVLVDMAMFCHLALPDQLAKPGARRMWQPSDRRMIVVPLSPLRRTGPRSSPPTSPSATWDCCTGGDI